MSIVGLGTDLVEIARIEKIIAKSGDALAKRILTAAELAQYHELAKSSLGAQAQMAPLAPQARFLAKRFAAKEAAAKAFGTGIACGVTFHDFCVTHDERGKPELQLAGVAAVMARERHIDSLLLSLSDERHYVVATVLLQSTVSPPKAAADQRA
ncbi:MAG: holo-ACP synthase [Vibrionaceae bacterium]